ncbi:hypothetical protein Tco_0693896 [Tanacetum coccineum]
MKVGNGGEGGECGYEGAMLPDKLKANKQSLILSQRKSDAEALAKSYGAAAVRNSWILNSIAAFLCNILVPDTVRVGDLSKPLRVDKQSIKDILEVYFSDGRIILDNLLEAGYIEEQWPVPFYNGTGGTGLQ